MHFRRPCAGSRALHPLGFAALLGVAGVTGAAGCSGTNDSGSSLFGSGSNVISTCQQICNNVATECIVAPAVSEQCTSACNDLILVPQSCLTQFAGYLACLSGATSISCPTSGTVLISPASCMEQEQTYATCNGGASPISACIALPPSNTACAPSTSSEGLANPGKPVFCVGQPSGCTPSGSNPFGIGTYCCN